MRKARSPFGVQPQGKLNALGSGLGNIFGAGWVVRPGQWREEPGMINGSYGSCAN